MDFSVTTWDTLTPSTGSDAPLPIIEYLIFRNFPLTQNRFESTENNKQIHNQYVSCETFALHYEALNNVTKKLNEKKVTTIHVMTVFVLVKRQFPTVQQN